MTTMDCEMAALVEASGNEETAAPAAAAWRPRGLLLATGCAAMVCLGATAFGWKPLTAHSEGIVSLQAAPSTFSARIVPVDEPSDFVGPRGAAKTAICFSGGGQRSAALTLGYLRGLNNLGLLDKVDQIVAQSGSAWTIVPYMFLDGQADSLFGPRTDPTKLDLNTLSQPLDNKSLGYPLTQSSGDASTAAVTSVFLGQILPEDAQTVLFKNYFLAPFNLDDATAYVAGSEEQVESIKARNPQLKASTFITPKRSKSLIVTGTTFAARDGNDVQNAASPPTNPSFVSFQMSPDFIGGVRPQKNKLQYAPLPPATGGLSTLVGGGFVESFAFGGAAPTQACGEKCGKDDVTVCAVGQPAAPFSLAKMLAVTTGRPFGPPTFPLTIPVPRVQWWPFAAAGAVPDPATTFDVGDGGSTESSSLLPALQSGVKSLVVFAMGDEGLQGLKFDSVTGATDIPKLDWCNRKATEPSARFSAWLKEDMHFADYFGYGVFLNGVTGIYSYSRNQVFEQDKYWKLMCGLQKEQEAGNPPVYAMDLKVLKNDWWKIEESTVHVVFSFLDRTSGFTDKLPADTQDALNNPNTWQYDSSRSAWQHFPPEVYVSGAPYGPFPLWPTLGTNTNPQQPNNIEFLKLTSAQINLLAALGEYTIMTKAVQIRKALSYCA